MSRFDCVRLRNLRAGHLDRRSLAVIFDDGIRVRTRRDPYSVSFLNDHYMEHPVLPHSGKSAVAVSLVLVQSEVTVCSCIDTDIDGILITCRGLHLLAERNNRASSDIDWNFFQRCFRDSVLTTGNASARPEVNPGVA